MSNYKVHKFESENGIDQEELEDFLNRLEGHVEAIIPELGKEYYPKDVVSRVRHLLIVERLKEEDVD
jgi:arsenate reductase-like glutaredoxin family protein